MKNESAFSIVEMTAVIVIMGVLAVMAIPNYLISLNRANARAALDNLLAIQAAQLVYFDAKNSYYDSSSGNTLDDTSSINRALHLNITPGEISYYCDFTYICHANLSSESGFNIALDLKQPMNKIGNNLVYCDGAAPNLNYNPCCVIPNGGKQKPGSICP